jgi:L-lactate utilization protein LutC
MMQVGYGVSGGLIVLFHSPESARPVAVIADFIWVVEGVDQLCDE